MTSCPLCLFQLERDRGHLARCVYEVATEERPPRNRGRPTATRYVELEDDERALDFRAALVHGPSTTT